MIGLQARRKAGGLRGGRAYRREVHKRQAVNVRAGCEQLQRRAVIRSRPFFETARLPASNTTSGLIGVLLDRHDVEFREKGLISPATTTGRYPAKCGSLGSIAILSVYPPIVSAFQAWAGSSIGWDSSAPRRSGCIALQTFPPDTQNRRCGRSTSSPAPSPAAARSTQVLQLLARSPERFHS